MEKISRYTIKRKIDAGGMATVFLAEDEALRRDVAVKTIHPHLIGRPDAVKRFGNEARAIANLSHQNIVRLYDFGEEDGKQFLVMEFVDGLTLDPLIARGPMPNLVLLELASQIFSGLSAAHGNGVYHRDIKPSNIMVDKYGCVKIMDFGIAYLVNEESLTMTGTFLGSPNYIAPEQADGRRVTATTDVFSAGAVLYQCATGRPPFDGDNPHAIIYSIIHDECRPADEMNPALLGEVADFIKSCLLKDPGARPDPARCLGIIDDLCRSLGLTLGKSRMAEYVAGRERYISRENRELRDRYVELGRGDFRRRRWVSSLRYFSHAEQFGPLEAEDRSLMKKIGRGMTLQKTMLIGAVVAAAIVAAAAGLPLAARMLTAPRQARPVQPAVVAPVDTTVDARASDTSSRTADSVVGAVSPAPIPAPRGSRDTSPGIASPSADAPGYLQFKTRPPYVQILVDGTLISATPLSGPVRFAAGQHSVSVRREGYATFDTLIIVPPADTISLVVALAKLLPQDDPPGR